MYIIPECDYTILLASQDIPYLTTPIAYAWKQDDRYLYVGRSFKGSERFTHHQIIGKVSKIKETDLLLIWKSNDSIQLEVELIKLYQPQHNIVHTANLRNQPVFNEEGKQICYCCGKIIRMPRNNKIFCSSKCKSKAWTYGHTPYVSKYRRLDETTFLPYDSDS